MGLRHTIWYIGRFASPRALTIYVYLPHDAKGETTLAKTRLFRGRLFRLVAFDHLYHLEHHLYPAVPHHHWPTLAARLEPHLTHDGVRSFCDFR